MFSLFLGLVFHATLSCICTRQWKLHLFDLDIFPGVFCVSLSLFHFFYRSFLILLLFCLIRFHETQHEAHNFVLSSSLDDSHFPSLDVCPILVVSMKLCPSFSLIISVFTCLSIALSSEYFLNDLSCLLCLILIIFSSIVINFPKLIWFFWITWSRQLHSS